MAVTERDYCTMPELIPETGTIQDVGPCEDVEGGQCTLCQGDCDDDDMCADGLVCQQRDADEVVVGCDGEAEDGTDYCVVGPEEVDPGTVEPEFDPTDEPAPVFPDVPEIELVDGQCESVEGGCLQCQVSCVGLEYLDHIIIHTDKDANFENF